MTNRALIPALACCLLLVAFSKSSAQSDEQIQSARAVAAAWLIQIDAGHYSDSYESACDAMQQKVGTKDKWGLVLQNLRAPWGAVISRKEVSHNYKPEGIEGLPGECMLITYNTAFQNLPQGIEAIALQWDGGRWRPAGYNAMAKPADSADSAPPPQ